MVMLYFSPFFEAIKLRGWYAYVSAQFGYDLICIIYNNHCDGIEPSHLCVGYPRLWCFLWHCQHPTGLNIPTPSNLKVFSSSVSCLLPFSSLSYVTKLICVESREHAPHVIWTTTKVDDVNLLCVSSLFHCQGIDCHIGRVLFRHRNWYNGPIIFFFYSIFLFSFN